MDRQDVTEDPATNLRIIDVPGRFLRHFGDFQNGVIHWFGFVWKYNRMWQRQQRVAVFSDSCVYLCHSMGKITRCITYHDIRELVITHESAIGFRVPDSYDALIAFDDPRDRAIAADIVCKGFRNVSGHDCVVKRLAATGGSDGFLQQWLDLGKPKGFVLRIEPLRTAAQLTKVHLEKQAREVRHHAAVAVEMDRIRAGLQQELMSYRTEEFESAKTQLRLVKAAIQAADKEIATLKVTRLENMAKSGGSEKAGCLACASSRAWLDNPANEERRNTLTWVRVVEEQRQLVRSLELSLVKGHLDESGSSAGGDPTAAASSKPSSAFAGKSIPDSAAEALERMVAKLKVEVDAAHTRNAQLQHFILESDSMTEASKMRVVGIVKGEADSSATLSSAPQKQAKAPSLTGAAGNAILHEEVIRQLDVRIARLLEAVRDETERQKHQLDRIKQEVQRYDAAILSYLHGIVGGDAPLSDVWGPNHHKRPGVFAGIAGWGFGALQGSDDSSYRGGGGGIDGVGGGRGGAGSASDDWNAVLSSSPPSSSRTGSGRVAGPIFELDRVVNRSRLNQGFSALESRPAV